jgi:hypothetical protein
MSLLSCAVGSVHPQQPEASPRKKPRRDNNKQGSKGSDSLAASPELDALLAACRGSEVGLSAEDSLCMQTAMLLADKAVVEAALPDLASLSAQYGDSGAMQQLAWVCRAHAVLLPVSGAPDARSPGQREAVSMLLDACPLLLLLRTGLATPGPHTLCSCYKHL